MSIPSSFITSTASGFKVPGSSPALSGANLSELASFFAYSSTFTGGVRVAAEDVNGDGFADIITTPGAGIPSQLTVWQGTSLVNLQSFNAYDPAFLGGVFVG